MTKLHVLLPLILSVPTLAQAQVHDPHNVYGTWLTASGNAHVEISECDGAPCGKSVWINAPNAAELKDVNNPDPAKRANPLVGTDIIWGFKSGKSGWKSGTIYDAEDGKVYKSKIRLKEDDTLKVQGCVAIICQTQIWTRVAG